MNPSQYFFLNTKDFDSHECLGSMNEYASQPCSLTKRNSRGGSPRASIRLISIKKRNFLVHTRPSGIFNARDPAPAHRRREDLKKAFSSALSFLGATQARVRSATFFLPHAYRHFFCASFSTFLNSYSYIVSLARGLRWADFGGSRQRSLAARDPGRNALSFSLMKYWALSLLYELFFKFLSRFKLDRSVTFRDAAA